MRADFEALLYKADHREASAEVDCRFRVIQIREEFARSGDDAVLVHHGNVIRPDVRIRLG
jgi:hypothetical protein